MCQKIGFLTHHCFILDAFHQRDQRVAVRRAAGGETDAAIAHQRRGHAMPGRGGEVAVPHRLAIIMGVDIDKSWGDQQAMGVDFLRAPRRHRADGADHAAIDGDIGGEAGAAGAIQHMAAANDEVVAHDCAPRMRRPGRAPVAWPWAWTIWPATRVAA